MVSFGKGSSLLPGCHGCLGHLLNTSSLVEAEQEMSTRQPTRQGWHLERGHRVITLARQRTLSHHVSLQSRDAMASIPSFWHYATELSIGSPGNALSGVATWWQGEKIFGSWHQWVGHIPGFPFEVSPAILTIVLVIVLDLLLVLVQLHLFLMIQLSAVISETHTVWIWPISLKGGKMETSHIRQRQRLSRYFYGRGVGLASTSTTLRHSTWPEKPSSTSNRNLVRECVPELHISHHSIHLMSSISSMWFLLPLLNSQRCDVQWNSHEFHTGHLNLLTQVHSSAINLNFDQGCIHEMHQVTTFHLLDLTPPFPPCCWFWSSSAPPSWSWSPPSLTSSAGNPGSWPPRTSGQSSCSPGNPGTWQQGPEGASPWSLLSFSVLFTSSVFLSIRHHLSHLAHICPTHSH